MRRLLVVLLACMLVAVVGPAAASSDPLTSVISRQLNALQHSGPQSVTSVRPEVAMIELVNQQREANGLNPLSFSPQLSDATSSYAARLLPEGQLIHDTHLISPNFRLVGEALAAEFGPSITTPEIVVAWMHSPEHRAVLLLSPARYIGIGVAHGSFGGKLGTVFVLRTANGNAAQAAGGHAHRARAHRRHRHA